MEHSKVSHSQNNETGKHLKKDVTKKLQGEFSLINIDVSGPVEAVIHNYSEQFNRIV